MNAPSMSLPLALRLQTRLPLLLLAGLLLLLALPHPLSADEQQLREIAQGLDTKDFAAKSRVIDRIAATGDPAAARVLEALGEGDLYFLKEDDSLVIGARQGRDLLISDPFTGEALGEIKTRQASKITVNNAIRRQIDATLGGLTLRSPDVAVRRAAAEAVFKSRDPAVLPAVEAALGEEQDAKVKEALEQAKAAILATAPDTAPSERLAAVGTIAESDNPEAYSLLAQLAGAEDPDVAAAAQEARASIEETRALWRNVQDVWYGLSLGSVLLLAAIGLAITFGVMGVINMAHGELVMLGAYTTFVVQETIRNSAPELFEWSLMIAAPLAFLGVGLVGIAIERGIVRYLYGRPLETLLATWGVSLALQQAVRSLFGPNNREVGNPDWMSGAFELGQLTITYNRFWILIFALLVFSTLLLVLRRTSLGLQMRAVTQNRAMAANMGIRTGWVDAMTFGLGAGIAGLAGVALSQIDNVSPNLGQSYTIDSFMVVVFGGVGNLFGALAGAFTLGVANKFLEPMAGAVLAKILVLVFIILFIQKRPRGLFALRGRAVEASTP